MNVWLLVILLTWTAVSGFIFIDAYRREDWVLVTTGRSQFSPLGWLVLAFLTGPIGWLAFLIMAFILFVMGRFSNN